MSPGTFPKHFEIILNLTKIGTISRCCVYVPLTVEIDPLINKTTHSDEQ